MVTFGHWCFVYMGLSDSMRDFSIPTCPAQCDQGFKLIELTIYFLRLYLKAICQSF